MGNCTIVGTRYHWGPPANIGGWHNYSTTESSYIYTPEKTWYSGGKDNTGVLCVKFTFNPTLTTGTNFNGATKLSIAVPLLRRQLKDAEALSNYNVYFKLYSSDPTTGTPTISSMTNLPCSSGNYDVSTQTYIGKRNDYTELVITVDFPSNRLSSLKPRTDPYYIIISSDALLTAAKAADTRWSIDTTYSTYTNGTAPSNLKVVDNGDNTFYFTGKSATNGTNNAISSVKFYYTTDGTDPASSSTRTNVAASSIDKLQTSGASFSSASNINPATPSNKRIRVLVQYTMAKGNVLSATLDDKTTLKYYVNPSAPGIPVISYSKTRLTIKEDWKFTWTAAKAGSTDAPVKGYRIRFCHCPGGGNEAHLTNMVYNSNSGMPTLTHNETVFNDKSGVIDTENTYTSLTIRSPKDFGISPGDKIRLQIYSYTYNGKNTKMFNDGGAGDAAVYSEYSLVEDTGYLRVYGDNGWTIGQVYYYNGSTWLKAEGVHYYNGSTWKESQ
jgi:hypothetical protein